MFRPSKPKLLICQCENPDGHVGGVWHPGQPVPDGVELVSELTVQKEAIAKGIKQIEMGGVAFRCGCPEDAPRNDMGVPLSHYPDGISSPCPSAIREDLGVIAYWHRNPLRRLRWRLSQRLQGRPGGSIVVRGS